MKRSEVDRSKLSPMMQQYMEIKDNYEDENVIIARIEFNEEGEPEYVAPTDEEFEAVKVAYEKFWEEEE